MTTPQEPTTPSNLFSPFLPSTYNMPEEPDRMKTYLVDRLCTFADVINYKKIGIYTQSTENLNGELWQYDSTKITRNGYQTIIRVTSFTNDLTIPMPFSINNQFVITLVYGSASLPPTTPGTGDYFSFMAAGDSRISFTMSDTEVVISTDGMRASYNGYIVIHYLRDGD